MSTADDTRNPLSGLANVTNGRTTCRGRCSGGVGPCRSSTLAPSYNAAMSRRVLPRASTTRLDRPNGRPEEWFLGALQARVLRALAKRGPSTVRDVVGALGGRLAYTTVMTVLGRLHKKGLVSREVSGKGYRYTSLYSETELRDRMAKYLVDEIVEDFGDVALAHFASALSRADRRRLARLRRPT